MNKKIIIVGVLGALAVGLGAFGAHGLKPLIDAADLATYKTAVFYQMIHTVVLLGLAFWGDGKKWLNRAFWFILVGILLFAGSLYLISTKELLGMTNWKWLGPITPLGGLSFIIGWLMIAIFGLRQKK